MDELRKVRDALVSDAAVEAYSLVLRSVALIVADVGFRGCQDSFIGDALTSALASAEVIDGYDVKSTIALRRQATVDFVDSFGYCLVMIGIYALLVPLADLLRLYQTTMFIAILLVRDLTSSVHYTMMSSSFDVSGRLDTAGMSLDVKTYRHISAITHLPPIAHLPLETKQFFADCKERIWSTNVGCALSVFLPVVVAVLIVAFIATCRSLSRHAWFTTLTFICGCYLPEVADQLYWWLEPERRWAKLQTEIRMAELSVLVLASSFAITHGWPAAQRVWSLFIECRQCGPPSVGVRLFRRYRMLILTAWLTLFGATLIVIKTADVTVDANCRSSMDPAVGDVTHWFWTPVSNTALWLQKQLYANHNSEKASAPPCDDSSKTNVRSTGELLSSVLQHTVSSPTGLIGFIVTVDYVMTLTCALTASFVMGRWILIGQQLYQQCPTTTITEGSPDGSYVDRPPKTLRDISVGQAESFQLLLLAFDLYVRQTPISRVVCHVAGVVMITAVANRVHSVTKPFVLVNISAVGSRWMIRVRAVIAYLIIFALPPAVVYSLYEPLGDSTLTAVTVAHALTTSFKAFGSILQMIVIVLCRHESTDKFEDYSLLVQASVAADTTLSAAHEPLLGGQPTDDVNLEPGYQATEVRAKSNDTSSSFQPNLTAWGRPPTVYSTLYRLGIMAYYLLKPIVEFSQWSRCRRLASSRFAALTSFPVALDGNFGGGLKVCSICGEPVGDIQPASFGREPVMGRCQHVYHGNCIRAWLELRNCCPACCRGPLVD